MLTYNIETVKIVFFFKKILNWLHGEWFEKIKRNNRLLSWWNIDGFSKQLRINWGVIRVPFIFDEKLYAENQIKNSKRAHNQEKDILMSGIKTNGKTWSFYDFIVEPFLCEKKIIEFMARHVNYNEFLMNNRYSLFNWALHF